LTGAFYFGELAHQIRFRVDSRAAVSQTQTRYPRLSAASYRLIAKRQLIGVVLSANSSVCDANSASAQISKLFGLPHAESISCRQLKPLVAFRLKDVPLAVGGCLCRFR